MVLSIGSALLAGLATLLVVVTLRSSATVEREALETGHTTAEAVGQKVAAQLNRALETTRTLADALNGIRSNGGDTRAPAAELLRRTLERSSDIAAIWTCWEPDAWDHNDAAFTADPAYGAQGRFSLVWDRRDVGVSRRPRLDYQDQDYYRLPAQRAQETILEPYLTSAAGSAKSGSDEKRLMTSIAVPVLEGSKVIGVVGIDLELTRFSQQLAGATLGDLGYLTIVSYNGLYAGHPKAERRGQSFLEHDPWAEAYLSQLKSGQPFEARNESRTLGGPAIRIAGPIEIGHTGTPWTAIVNLSRTEMMQPVRELRNLSIGIGLGVLLLMLGLVYLLAGSIAKPINRLADRLRAGSREVTVAADDINRAGTTLAENASAQAASIEETSASCEELNAVVQSNADTAKATRDLAETSRRRAETSEKEMRDMVSAMNDIQESAQAVARIVDSINEIAFQTNLLALNAAVEAARAGSAGAGFAVVAEEVRTLAQRAAKAAQESSERIEVSVERANRGSAICGRVETAFSDIRRAASEVSNLTDNIASASQEQAEGIKQINAAIIQIDHHVQNSAAQTEETASASSELHAQAVSMSDSVSELVALVNGQRARSGSGSSANSSPATRPSSSRPATTFHVAGR